MRRVFLLLIILSLACCLSCRKTSFEFDEKIMGDWLVVGTDSTRNDSGITVEWGLYYLNKIGLKQDHQFTVNGSPFSTGFWELKDNDQNLSFYTEVDDVGTAYRDTTEFHVSINDKDELILSDESRTFIHRRIH